MLVDLLFSLLLDITVMSKDNAEITLKSGLFSGLEHKNIDFNTVTRMYQQTFILISTIVSALNLCARANLITACVSNGKFSKFDATSQVQMQRQRNGLQPILMIHFAAKQMETVGAKCATNFAKLKLLKRLA